MNELSKANADFIEMKGRLACLSFAVGITIGCLLDINGRLLHLVFFVTMGSLVWHWFVTTIMIAHAESEEEKAAKNEQGD